MESGGNWKIYIALATERDATRGVATGVDIGIYTPPKSAKVNFLWGKNDVRTAIQQFYPPPKTFIPPQNKFLATPLDATLLFRKKKNLEHAIFRLVFLECMP